MAGMNSARINWHVEWKMSFRSRPQEERGLQYSTWSNYQPTVADPAGTADMAEVWYTGRWFMVHLSLFRD